MAIQENLTRLAADMLRLAMHLCMVARKLKQSEKIGFGKRPTIYSGLPSSSKDLCPQAVGPTEVRWMARPARRRGPASFAGSSIRRSLEACMDHDRAEGEGVGPQEREVKDLQHLHALAAS